MADEIDIRMDELADFICRTISVNEDGADDELEFNAFERSTDKFNIGAIDGGSANILNAGSFIIGARKVGFLIYDSEGNIVNRSIKPSLNIIAKQESMEEENDRVRESEEIELMSDAMEELNKDDILLIDGEIKVKVEAYEKGVEMAGIIKRTSLYMGDAPLLLHAWRKGQSIYPGKNWFCKIGFGSRYVVKFNPASRFVFMVDLPEGVPERVFGKIAKFSDDLFYLGYPYPLAEIHNDVVIDNVEDIMYRLQSMTIEKGLQIEDWEILFQNFHDVLDFMK